MRETTIYKTLNKYKTELENKGYNVIYIGLYGSQNYNLDDEKSDIDARAVILPTFDDYVMRKTTSKVYQFESGEVDVKDIITFNDILRKGNPAYVEIATTKYFIGDKEFRRIIENSPLRLRAVYGMMHEKLKAIEKGLPKSCEFVETHGYDPKQLHHLKRLETLAQHYIATGEPIYEYSGEEKGNMMFLKRQPLFRLDEVIDISKTSIEKVDQMIGDESFKPLENQQDVLDFIKGKLSEDLIKNTVDMSARQYRTFGQPIPKRDKLEFEKLKEYDGQDISYIIYSYLQKL